MGKKIFLRLIVLFLFIMAVYVICRETTMYEISGCIQECTTITYKDGNGYVEDKFVVIQRDDGVKAQFRNDDDLLCLKRNSDKLQKIFNDVKGKANSGVVLTVDGFGNVRKAVPYFKRVSKPDPMMNRVDSDIVGVGETKTSDTDATKVYILSVNLDLHASTWTYDIHEASVQTNTPPNKWRWRELPENSIHGILRIVEPSGSNIVRRVRCANWSTGMDQ